MLDELHVGAKVQSKYTLKDMFYQIIPDDKLGGINAHAVKDFFATFFPEEKNSGI